MDGKDYPPGASTTPGSHSPPHKNSQAEENAPPPLPTRRPTIGGYPPSGSDTGGYPVYPPLPFDTAPADQPVRQPSPFDPSPLAARTERRDYAFDGPSFHLRRAPAEPNGRGDERNDPRSVGAPPRGPRHSKKPDQDADDDGRRHMPLWQEMPLLLVVAFCLAVLIRSFLLQAFFIPSSSMEQTLLVGDRVLVNKVVYDLREPRRGEVIVFRGTNDWAPENFSTPATGVLSRIGRTMGDLVGVSRPGEKDFIKRVIGLPGDRVSCCDPQGRVYVNGKGINEPYINVNSSLDVPPSSHTCGARRFREIQVPPGQLFVMGDNRIVSQDSRCQGPVPIENVIGRAFVIVWPSGRWNGLGVPDTFASVPDPVALGRPVQQQAPAAAAASFSYPVTLPILASLVGSTRRGRTRQWRTRTLPQ